MHRRLTPTFAALLVLAGLLVGAAPARADVGPLQYLGSGFGPYVSETGRLVTYIEGGLGPWTRYDRTRRSWYRFPTWNNESRYSPILSRNHNALYWRDREGRMWRNTAGGAPFIVRPADGYLQIGEISQTDASGNLVAVRVRNDRITGFTAGVYNVSARALSLYRIGTDRHGETPSIDASGRYLAFASDELVGCNPGCGGIWVRDRTAAKNILVSVNLSGRRSVTGMARRPQITSDGRYVVFLSNQTDLVAGATTRVWRVYARDLVNRTTRVLMTAPEGYDTQLSVSTDLTKVAYTGARNASGVAQAYLLDRRTGITTMLSRSAAGAPGNSNTVGTTVSANGLVVAFRSASTNLGVGPTTIAWKNFIRTVR